MNGAAELEYLCVDRFLDTPLHARLLATAFELGVIDRLSQGRASRATLQTAIGADDYGIDLLLAGLDAGGVVTAAGGDIRLSEPFRAALEFRDLIEAKLDFLAIAAADILTHFTDLVVNPPRYVAAAGTFRLFDYARALQPSGTNEAWTRRWVRITTALTRYEAAACLSRHDFSRACRLVDVGGNSGEFARRICAANPGLTATVVDLPVVCAIGRDHLRGTPEAARVRFVESDAVHAPLPSGADVITFKSMLHDWMERDATTLLGRAFDALAPGGTLLIFERAPIDLRARPLPYALLPILVFARWLRDPALYASHLQAIGFTSVTIDEIALETPFMLVRARKPPLG
jgi:SAM-dependent methyltransferase